MRKTVKFFRTLNRDAALDSARNVMAVLGVGTVLANFSTMAWWFIAPGLALLGGTWYGLYLRYDLSSATDAPRG